MSNNEGDIAANKKDNYSNAIENKRLTIEEQKLQIELQKLKIEKSKLMWSSLLGIIPLLAVVFTIFYGVHSQRQQERTQFQLKAAEIMFNGKDAYEIRSRADILNMIFPDKLPADFSKKFYPDSLGYYSRYEIDAKLELLKMLVSKSKDRDEIIDNWKKVFPDDKWIDSFHK